MHPPQCAGQATGHGVIGLVGTWTGRSSCGSVSSCGDTTPAATPCPHMPPQLSGKQMCHDPATASPSHPSYPSSRGFPVPLRAPGATGSAAQPAITRGKAVTLQQTSLLSPATNQGQAAALLDRACWYVLLLLMSCCHTLNGDTQESDVTRQRLGPTAHLGAPVLRASSLPLAEMRVSTRDAWPGMFSSPRAALALPLTSANVVRSFAEPIFRASHHMRFLHRETGNADEVVRHGAAFSSLDE